MKRSLGIALLVAVACIPLAAQHTGMAPQLPARPAGFQPGFSGIHHGRGLPFLFPFGYYDSYPDYAFYPESMAQPTQPQIVVVQPPARPAADPAPTPAQPLLIELRGDSYVRVSGDADTKSQTLAPETAPAKNQKPQPQVNARAQIQPALLVFRDGHEEEIANYMISNGVLYASADYYTAGSWNRAIEISALNVPQTIATNQTRGVPFHLPTAPNEVVVGP